MAPDSTTGGGAVLGQRKAATKAATLVAGIALLASGCRTDRKVTVPEPVPVNQARVTAALITIDDLPNTFTAAEQGTPIDTEMIEEHSCDDAIADLDPERADTADFTTSDTRFTTTVAWFPGNGPGVEQVYRDVAFNCQEVVVADQGLSLRTFPLRFGVLSDDTLALKFELEQADGSIEERDLIVIRLGDLVSIVRLTGPRPSDKVLLDSVVRVALGRLGQLSDDTT